MRELNSETTGNKKWKLIYECNIILAGENREDYNGKEVVGQRPPDWRRKYKIRWEPILEEVGGTDQQNHSNIWTELNSNSYNLHNN